jgi:putative phosphoesterase
MRVAAISDIHGNLPALEAVLADIERETVDAIVVAGDSFSGPWPSEVVDRLGDVGALAVHGNADRLDVIRTADSALADWNEAHLGGARLAVAAAWPLTMELDINGLGNVLVCHATPYSDEPIYTRITPDDELVELLGPVDADVLVCGHTHMQYDRLLSSGLRVVNPGSVGMPYEGGGGHWALLGPTSSSAAPSTTRRGCGCDPRAAVTGARSSSRSSSIRRRRTRRRGTSSLRGA